MCPNFLMQCLHRQDSKQQICAIHAIYATLAIHAISQLCQPNEGSQPAGCRKAPL